MAINLRDGVQLAVDDINAGGGIKGRPIQLIIEDDLGTPEGARAAENKLIDAGVVAVVGHLTSSQTIAGYQVTEDRKTVLISATAATATLAGIKDLYLAPPHRPCIWEGNSPDISFWNVASPTWRSSWMRIIMPIPLHWQKRSQAVILKLGGEVSSQVSFSSNTVVDFIPYVYGLRLSNPDAVLIITSPPDAGIIAQQIRLQKWDIPLFAGHWARGEELLRNGGSAVEGLELIIAYDSDAPNTRLEAFTTHFVDRYTRQPAFTAVYGYEVMQVLAAALETTEGQAAGLADALSNVSGVRDFNRKRDTQCIWRLDPPSLYPKNPGWKVHHREEHHDPGLTK